MLETSEELQFTVLSSLCKDSNLLTTVSNDITPSFFTGGSYQFIYKLLKIYNSQYSGVPNNHEITVMVNSYYNKGYGEKSDILDLIQSCYTSPVSDPSFVKDNVESFIKRVKFENILINLVDNYNSNKDLRIESVVDDILDTYNYTMTELDLFNLDNPDDFIRARKKALGSNSNPHVIKSSIDGINRNLLYKGYKYGDLGVVVAAPSVGKTTFLINEGSCFLKQGFNVLHLFIGDMTEYSIFLKYISCMTEQPMELFANDPQYYSKTLETHPVLKMFNPFARLNIAAYPPGEVSANQINTIVDQIQKKMDKHIDVIIVDYADNLLEESDTIYSNGGKIYNKLKSLAMTNLSVVLTASQPKQYYFNEEVLPFDCMAESSKKTHIIDIMLTIGKPSRGADIATIHCAKMREGNTGVLKRIKSHMEKSIMKECSDVEYFSRKQELMEIQKSGIVEGMEDV